MIAQIENTFMCAGSLLIKIPEAIALLSEEDKNRLNILYARDYHLANDVNILFKGLRNLGRT